MDFRTEITPSRGNYGIDLAKKGFSAGSCFAENIAGRLAERKFNIVSNPFGVMFNPASIATMLHALHDGRVFTEADLATDGDLWFSWLHHGDFSDCDAGRVLERINGAARKGAEALHAADYVILTFGTAWIYLLGEDCRGGTAGAGLPGRVVANCHKMPSGMFRRRRMGVGEIVSLFAPMLAENGMLADKRVILTVSPVRHLKDGFEENSMSKAVLRVATGELAERFDNVDYFPAYEILNDDLRDYRFYADDMAHPAAAAVEYVWGKFGDVYFGDATRGYVRRIERVVQAMRHRVMKPGSGAAAKFMAAQYEQTMALSHELPWVDFSAELEYFGAKR